MVIGNLEIQPKWPSNRNRDSLVIVIDPALNLTSHSSTPPDHRTPSPVADARRRPDGRPDLKAQAQALGVAIDAKQSNNTTSHPPSILIFEIFELPLPSCHRTCHCQCQTPGSRVQALSQLSQLSQPSTTKTRRRDSSRGR